MFNATSDPDPRMRDVARHWVVRLASGNMAAEELARFSDWFNASSDNASAFRLERDRWAALSHAREELEKAASEGAATLRGQRAPVAWAGALAAAVTCCAIGLGLFEFPNADFETPAGEIQAVDLPDGSRAWLNSDSAIDIDYQTSERRIHLRRGEAWFDVARNPDRPFVVDAAGVTATAKGTAFSVTRLDQSVSVEVTHGVVVATAHDGARSELRVGQSATFIEDDAAILAPFVADEALAWRSREIVLNGMPLGDALSELDRFLPGRIVFRPHDGPVKPINAILTFGRLDEGLSSLAASQGYEVIHMTPWLTIVL